MTRSTAPDVIEVRPTNNVYTVLVVVATLVVILGLVVVFMRANTLFPETGLL
jgi:hypothetical protein